MPSGRRRVPQRAVTDPSLSFPHHHFSEGDSDADSELEDRVDGVKSWLSKNKVSPKTVSEDGSLKSSRWAWWAWASSPAGWSSSGLPPPPPPGECEHKQLESSLLTGLLLPSLDTLGEESLILLMEVFRMGGGCLYRLAAMGGLRPITEAGSWPAKLLHWGQLFHHLYSPQTPKCQLLGSSNTPAATRWGESQAWP